MLVKEKKMKNTRHYKSWLYNENNNPTRKVQRTDSTADVLNAISDHKSLAILRSIAIASADSGILISNLNLTPKQYYSRLYSLVRAGLIRKEKRKHFLTSFGKIVYGAQLTIGRAISNSWKLKAIDSIGTSGDLPLDEHLKIINTIIDDREIKEILLSESSNLPAIDLNDNKSSPDDKVENRYIKSTGK
jgi:hypothetical protein